MKADGGKQSNSEWELLCCFRFTASVSHSDAVLSSLQVPTSTLPTARGWFSPSGLLFLVSSFQAAVFGWLSHVKKAELVAIQIANVGTIECRHAFAWLAIASGAELEGLSVEFVDVLSVAGR